jgi:hypothetical protein
MNFNDKVTAERAKLFDAYVAENGEPAADKLADVKSRLLVRAKQLVKGAEHKANVGLLIEFAEKYGSTDENPEVMAAVKALTTKEATTRIVTSKNGKVTPRGLIAELFNDIGVTVSVQDIFNKYRQGPKEIKEAIKTALKKSETADRKWIQYNSDEESFTLLDIGPNAPTGYTGYTPLAK